MGITTRMLGRVCRVAEKLSRLYPIDIAEIGAGRVGFAWGVSGWR